MGELKVNLEKIREEISRALLRRGGKPEEVILVGVSKNVSVDRIEKAINGGVEHIGENRIQEARAKFKSIKGPATWHLIGHLQRNKVRHALGIFDLIHSLDRKSLAQEIQKRAARQGIVVPCLVQVNVAGEVSKFGLPPGELKPFLNEIAGFPNIKVKGLMTIAPFSEDPEAVRPVFRRLRELFDDKDYPPEVKMEFLSMGMSNDFVVAVEEGANMVRIGSRLFGSREYK
jgi:pyridoxal phosphate enzyme (YggS family)